ncbi:hypothetical protein AB4Y96_08180 [Phyllobacterium sp. TAF24]|uniref:hypothetical protein n=1 Tax=Phyllobacterium sp. TAF24 TaxID=3233068 RepID=UPI003F996A78
MTQLFSQNMNVYYGQMYFEFGATFDGDIDNCFRGQSNGICGASAPNLLFLITGTHTGEVGLTINLFEAEPGIDASWDEIVEVSLLSSTDTGTLLEWAADSGHEFPIPAGSYRARYYARNMQAGNDSDGNETSVPADIYRLDLWKAGPSHDHIVKQTSEVAAYWHNWAANLQRNR